MFWVMYFIGALLAGIVVGAVVEDVFEPLPWMSVVFWPLLFPFAVIFGCMTLGRYLAKRNNL
jgi:hypothetical protein